MNENSSETLLKKAYQLEEILSDRKVGAHLTLSELKEIVEGQTPFRKALVRTWLNSEKCTWVRKTIVVDGKTASGFEKVRE